MYYIHDKKTKCWGVNTTCSEGREIKRRVAKSQCRCIVKILKGIITSKPIVLFEYDLHCCDFFTYTFRMKYHST